MSCSPFQSALVGVFSSFIFMTWLCVKAQLAINEGEIHYESKPVSVKGCKYDFELPQFTPTNATAIASEAT